MKSNNRIKKKQENNSSKYKMFLIIIILIIIIIVSIIGVYRHNSKIIKKEYESIAKASYKAMEEYNNTHPYERNISLEQLEKEEFLNNRIDPRNKRKKCSGVVEVDIRPGANKTVEYGNYTVYLCCSNYSKKYIFPDEIAMNIKDNTKCNNKKKSSIVNKENIDQSKPTYTCSKGKYLPKSSDKCEPCLNSYYCLGGTFNQNESTDQGLTPCPQGYNNSNIGSSKENQCYMIVPENKYVKNSKDKSSTNCDSGQLKESHKVGYGDISSCSQKNITVIFDCNSGTGGGTAKYTSGVSNQKFTKKCTKSGKIQDGWKTKRNAKTREYLLNNIVTDSWILKNYPKKTLYANWRDLSVGCSEGYYVKRNETLCSKCLKNNYCPGGTYTLDTSKDQGLISCPEGYNNSKVGSSKIEQCYMKVTAGKYIKTKTATSQTSCKRGTFKKTHKVYYGSTSKCDNCPEGYNNSKVGSTKITQCYMKVLKNKYVKKKKDKTATQCESGNKNTPHIVNYNSTSTCKPKSYICPPGEYLKRLSTTCSKCPQGYFCKGGTHKYSVIKDQGIESCPKGYNKSKTASTSAKQCYMNVPKNKYIKKKNDQTPSKCPANSLLKEHKVYYGKVSATCKCNSAPIVKCSSSDSGGFRCIVGEETQSQIIGNYFNISGCTSGLSGFICYLNPNGSNCTGSRYYKNNTHYDNGYGHIAFKRTKWAYYRSTEQAWALICNESKCSNFYKSY